MKYWRTILCCSLWMLFVLAVGSGAAQATVIFSNVADTTTTAPGHGLFFDFIPPSISGSNLAFQGFYNGGAGRGIYTGSVGAPGATKVVETGDTAPGHGLFNNVLNPSISGSNLAFQGGYSGGQGIYTGSVGATGATKVVETGDTAPGHGAFTGFVSSTSISGSNLAFQGSYSGGVGIYTGSVGATAATKVVETGDTAPGHGLFTGFSAFSISGSNLAFQGNHSDGSSIYLESGGSLLAVLSQGDVLFGSTVASFSLGLSGYDNNNNEIAFYYILNNGVRGIGVATVPEPTTFVLGALGLLGLGVAARRKKHRRA